MKDPNVRPKRVCSPKYAVMKARKGVSLNRWEIEDLSQDAFWSVQYAKKVLKGRFPEGEVAIGKVPSLAFEYAKEIVKGRFLEGEQAILNDCDRWGHRPYLKRYILDVAGVRNESFEESIKKQVLKGDDIGLAIEYATKCIGGRWQELEPEIVKEDLGWASQYHSKVLKARWPRFETRILFKKKKNRWEDREEAWQEYVEIVGQSPEIENRLMRTNRASLILVYAQKGLKGRLPQALHQKMMMFSFDPKRKGSAKKYLKWVRSCERRIVNYLSRLDEEERNRIVEMSSTK